MGGVGWEISSDFRKPRMVEGALKARIVTGGSHGIAATEKAEQETRCMKTGPRGGPLFHVNSPWKYSHPLLLDKGIQGLKHVTR